MGEGVILVSLAGHLSGSGGHLIGSEGSSVWVGGVN